MIIGDETGLSQTSPATDGLGPNPKNPVPSPLSTGSTTSDPCSGCEDGSGPITRPRSCSAPLPETRTRLAQKSSKVRAYPGGVGNVLWIESYQNWQRAQGHTPAPLRPTTENHSICLRLETAGLHALSAPEWCQLRVSGPGELRFVIALTCGTGDERGLGLTSLDAMSSEAAGSGVPPGSEPLTEREARARCIDTRQTR